MANSLSPAEQEYLLKKRGVLVEKVRALRANSPKGKYPAYRMRFHQEDLQALAKKILAIDRKLGRI